jgi:hypothetical protein
LTALARFAPQRPFKRGFVGVATQDIAINGFGLATAWGYRQQRSDLERWHVDHGHGRRLAETGRCGWDILLVHHLTQAVSTLHVQVGRTQLRRFRLTSQT